MQRTDSNFCDDYQTSEGVIPQASFLILPSSFCLSPMLKPFLTANWRYLAMLNFAVDPKILAPHVPAGTELDFYNDKTYLSVVGFLFYDTIVCGLPIPRHRNFEDVNLRIYVRKQPVRLAADTCARGVVFIRELVPKIAIAVTARLLRRALSRPADAQRSGRQRRNCA